MNEYCNDLNGILTLPGSIAQFVLFFINNVNAEKVVGLQKFVIPCWGVLRQFNVQPIQVWLQY